MQSDALGQFRNVLYEALAGAEPGVRDTGPVLILSRLAESCRPLANGHRDAAATIDRLAAVANVPDTTTGLNAAQATFETPRRFAEAVYFARCLGREAASTLSLLAAWRYVNDGAVADRYRDLATDRAALLDAVSFESLWQEPGRREWMLSTLSFWHREYAAAYSRGHAAYNTQVASIAEAMDAVAARALALERLNALERLGPALAVAALSQYHELERLFACQLAGEALNEALDAAPLCSECSYRLGDEAPTADAKRVGRAVERGLAGQQARLAQRVVSRLLSRPVESGEQRLTRFIQVVQASDLSGLALVLDDALVDFLAALLESADGRSSVLTKLSRAYPEVTPGNIDAAVHDFRTLLESELSRGGVVRLDQEAGRS